MSIESKLAKKAVERKDKARNIDKVAASLTKNPLQTAREVAKDTGLWASTANRARQELAQNGTKDERIQHLLEWDMLLLNQIQARKAERMNGKEVNDTDMDRWENTATKRKLIFWDETEWTKDIKVTFEI